MPDSFFFYSSDSVFWGFGIDDVIGWGTCGHRYQTGFFIPDSFFGVCLPLPPPGHVYVYVYTCVHRCK